MLSMFKDDGVMLSGVNRPGLIEAVFRLETRLLSGRGLSGVNRPGLIEAWMYVSNSSSISVLSGVNRPGLIEAYARRFQRCLDYRVIRG